MHKKLMQEAESLNKELVKWRRHIHSNPEVGLCMPETAAYIKSQLNEMGIEYNTYEDSSVVEVIIGSGEKCIMLRTDMDALPIEEESGETFSSDNGWMHACGHDFHAAAMLGTASLLKKHENELKGCVKLMFQPGEEVFKGAKDAIEKGVLEDPAVDAAFAIHVNSQMDLNHVVYGTYPQAAVYSFRIILRGKGTHGATPEKGINPINAAVSLYSAFQELIANEVSAMSEATLTIGKLAAGNAPNVIPDEAVLEGTLRAFDMDVRETLVNRFHEMVRGICGVYRTSYEIEVLSDVPALKCDDKLNEEIAETVRKLDDGLNVTPSFHAMGSEDFAYIAQKVPCAYFGIGAGIENGEERFSQHNSKVRFDERCLPLAAAINTAVAIEWLQSRR